MDDFDAFVRMAFRDAAPGDTGGREEIEPEFEAEFQAIMRKEFGTDDVHKLDCKQLGQLGQMWLRHAEMESRCRTKVVNMKEWRSQHQR